MQLRWGLALVLTGCFQVSNVPTPKACDPGQASRYDGSAWQCEPAVPTCTDGYPSWNGTAWTCASFPFATGSKPECPSGFPAWNGTGWSCAVSAPPECPNGFPSWSATGWTCGMFPAVTDLSSALATPESLAAHFGQATGTSVALAKSGTLEGAAIATSGGATDPGCLTVVHNWNTNAVGYSAWYSDTSSGTAVWIPVPSQANLSAENVAFHKAVSASPSNTTGAPALLVDGSTSTATGFVTPLNVMPTGSLTVDLGATYQLSQLSIALDLTAASANGTEVWHATLSDFPGSSEGATQIDSGTCTAGHICTANDPLPGNPAGRYLTWTCDQAWSTNQNNFCTITELQAYPVAGFSIVQPDANSVRICNYSGAIRDLALRVTR